LLANPSDAAALRSSASGAFTRASDLGDKVLVSGVFGEVLGAQIVRSRKIPKGKAFLVKAGAFVIYLKRNVAVETDRDILAKTTVISADEHYVATLADESKVVKLLFSAGE